MIYAYILLYLYSQKEEWKINRYIYIYINGSDVNKRDRATLGKRGRVDRRAFVTATIYRVTRGNGIIPEGVVGELMAFAIGHCSWLDEGSY